MTWIIVSVPLMVLAIAIAVVPVLLTAGWEARRREAAHPAWAVAGPPATAPGRPSGPELADAA